MTPKRRAILILPAVLSLSVGATNVWAHQNGTNATITLSPNPVYDPNPATITGKLTFTGLGGFGQTHELPTAGTPVEGANLQIQQLQNLGLPVPCGTPDSAYVTLAQGSTDANGEFQLNFQTAGLAPALICFRAHAPAFTTVFGPGHGGAQAQSPGLDLDIREAACVPGATITATAAGGDGTPDVGSPAGPWTFRITVTACGSLTGVTAQGGSNGWAPVTSLPLASTGSVELRKQNKNNSIYLWTIGNMVDGQTATLDVEVNGNIPKSAPECQLRFLSGPWSATFSADAGATYVKSDYTGRISISVDRDNDGNPGCP